MIVVSASFLHEEFRLQGIQIQLRRIDVFRSIPPSAFGRK
jgi:hypothetical protein